MTALSAPRRRSTVEAIRRAKARSRGDRRRVSAALAKASSNARCSTNTENNADAATSRAARPSAYRFPRPAGRPTVAAEAGPGESTATSLASSMVTHQPQGPRRDFVSWLAPATQTPPDGRVAAAPPSAPNQSSLRADKPVTPISRARTSNSATRFSTFGCVEKKLSTPRPLSGLMMKTCAAAGMASAGDFRRGAQGC